LAALYGIHVLEFANVIRFTLVEKIRFQRVDFFRSFFMGSEQKNAVLAVVLSGIILFGWQYFFVPKNIKSGPIEPTKVTAVKTDSVAQVKDGPIEPATVSKEVFQVATPTSLTSFENDLTIKDLQNSQASFAFKDIVDSASPFDVQFDFGQGFQKILFSKTQEANTYVGPNNIKLFLSVDDFGRTQFKVVSPQPFKYKFTLKSQNKKLENGQERFFSFYTDELNKLKMQDEGSGDKSVKWFGIDFNYHLFAVYFDKEENLLYQNNPDNTLSFASNKPALELVYHTVFAKKEYDYLLKLGNKLNLSVDFGMWGFFAVWILKGLQFFYQYFPNYGVAIILLTLLIRFITFPLQYKSFVSMKKLQLIQPELNKIREKYKDDNMKMQKETMDLFKKSGANPLGGCLPLLLQMPVFFAFYKVLYSAVELVDAKFYFWIVDLSNKDPYYVLPVLMTAAMFLQQKLTPNTITDPVQKKVMLFMPLIFGVIMKDLPAGLSLYIFVSTTLGILQQFMIFSSKDSAKPVVV